MNKAWAKSFAQIDKNKNTIADRGWNPLNRNILTFPDIMTMTTDEVEDKVASSEVILPTNTAIMTDLITEDFPSF